MTEPMSKPAWRTAIIVVFLVTAISLFSWNNHADAATRDAAELPAGVILEAGRIDSSTVKAGASVAVVYGLGYRDPVSGEWPRLTTARGTVHAVDGQRLLLALEGRDSLQRIDLERIQTLVLAGSPSIGSTDRDSTVTVAGFEAGSDGVDARVFAVDSGHAESGLQAMPDKSSTRTGITDNRGTRRRIAKKAGFRYS